MDIKKALTALNKKQNTITDLITLGKVLVKSNGQHRLNLPIEKIVVGHVYSDEKVSINIAKYGEKIGDYPMHKHEGIEEFLICIKGSFGVKLPHNGYRILKEKDCAQIPADILHSVLSLEPNSEILAICLPCEPAYIPKEGSKRCLKLQKKK